MAVNRNVLVPRPETELLAEFGWRFLSGIPPGSKALDIGTGSGCIAIALAVKCPDAKVIATDISSEALAVAAQNAETENLNGRISFIQSDLFAAVPSDQQFDLIISNPPYIPSAEIKTLQPEVRDFDPRMALDGGSDGLEFYRRIACESRPFLRTGGKIMLEFGDGQSDAVRRHFEDQKWIVEAIHQDYNQRPRILIARL